MRRELDRGDAREAFGRRAARGVGGTARRAAVGGAGRKVDDSPAPPARDHRLRGGLSHEKRAAAVDGVHAVPDLDPFVEQRGMGGDRRIVHADVEPPKASRGALDDRARPFRRADVGDDGGDPLAVRRACFGQAIFVPVGRDDLGTRAHELANERSADAAGRAGHDRHAPLEVEPYRGVHAGSDTTYVMAPPSRRAIVGRRSRSAVRR